jgi:photosystem II stability/assembly factor-like uncharacterized protein
MPYSTNGLVRDIYFIDSSLGFAVSDSSILKTTNGGDNWTIKLTGYYIFQKIQFLNTNTGYACGGNNKLLKTTDSGENWNIFTPAAIYPNDMYVLNEDTIWLASMSNPTGGVFRTTNGGISWQQQINLGSMNPNHIYFYNGRLGFIGRDNFYLRRTSDGGVNWSLISGTGGFLDMYFVDSLTGWKTSMQKTTNGGITWVNQELPSGGIILTNFISSFSNINKDTIWGNGGFVLFPNNQVRSILNRTTNGGDNWLFQIPDTSKINNIVYNYINFVNKDYGWAYGGSTGIHTTTGGDTVFYVKVKQISTEVPQGFSLYQNYPNPFNSSTIIKFQLSKPADIIIRLFDITGREVSVILNEKLNTGVYEITFDSNNYSSGIYYYSLITDGQLIDTKKMILLK